MKKDTNTQPAERRAFPAPRLEERGRLDAITAMSGGTHRVVPVLPDAPTR